MPSRKPTRPSPHQLLEALASCLFGMDRGHFPSALLLTRTQGTAGRSECAVTKSPFQACSCTAPHPVPCSLSFLTSSRHKALSFVTKHPVSTPTGLRYGQRSNDWFISQDWAPHDFFRKPFCTSVTSSSASRFSSKTLVYRRQLTDLTVRVGADIRPFNILATYLNGQVLNHLNGTTWQLAAQTLRFIQHLIFSS